VLTWLLGGDLLVGSTTLVAVTAAYLLAVGLVDLGWRWAQRRLLGVFAAILILDAVYLSWIAYAAGDSANPLRYLTVVHLVVVALLASYRTGLKLALWHSVLAWSAYVARDRDLLGAVPLPPGGGEYRDLVGFIVLFWLVTLATVTFSAVNERELRRRRYDLEALATLSDHVEVADTPQEVAATLLRNLAEAFGFQRMVVVGGPRDVMTLLASHGTVGRPATTYADADGSVVRRALTSRRPALVQGVDADADPWLDVALPGAGNLIVAPMSSDARALGVVVIEHSLAEGSRVERRVLTMTERFVAHAALALENAFLLEQLRQSASTDGLTGIANRRSFDVTLDRYLARAVSSFEPVSLVLLDIDHFKKLNDDHGHQVGDDVLRQVAGVLVEHARVVDVPARYGGEEFAVVLPECGEEEAAAVADRLRRAISASPTARPITVSAGVATFPEHGATAEALIRAADEALYRAKAAGRDRVVAASPVRAGEG
jgi:diguanylate cyclase (GGDEF)-like protein